MSLFIHFKKNYDEIMNIADNIKSFRKNKGLSQVALAKACGWDREGNQGRISNYETGRREASVTDLRLIAKALDIELQELISKEVTTNVRSQDLVSSTGKVPILDWSNIQPTGKIPEGNAHSIYCPADHSPNTYALKIRDDSMIAPTPGAKTYLEGTYIYVDPNLPPNAGDKVIASSASTGESTFKVYINDFGKSWLRPLNTCYHPIEVTSDIAIVGVVIGSYTPE